MNYLRIYLNDHLAASMGGLELARRLARKNSGTPLATSCDRLADEFSGERKVLADIMKTLGIAENHLKVLGAWVSEKLSRMKPSGELLSYSPLSRVIELEALTVGITGKMSMWVNLQHISDTETRLNKFSLTKLIEQAQKQRSEVEVYRIEAFRGIVGH